MRAKFIPLSPSELRLLWETCSISERPAAAREIEDESCHVVALAHAADGGQHPRSERATTDCDVDAIRRSSAVVSLGKGHWASSDTR